MKLQNTIAPLLMASAILVSGAAQAATQGTEGNDSTGSLDITLTKSEALHISGLADIALTVGASGTASGTSDVCVYRSLLTGYNLTATGNSDLATQGGGIGTLFGLQPDSGTGTGIEYTVKFFDADNIAGVDVVSGTPLPLNTPFNDAAENLCGTVADTAGTSGMSIQVSVSAEAYGQAENVLHTGTLSLTVAPQ